MCQTVHTKWHAESRHVLFFHLGMNFFIKFLAFHAWKMWNVSSQPRSLKQVAELPVSLTRKAYMLSIHQDGDQLVNHIGSSSWDISDTNITMLLWVLLSIRILDSFSISRNVIHSMNCSRSGLMSITGISHLYCCYF